MTPWVMGLLTANVAFFVASFVAPDLYASLALVPAAVLHRPWTLVTYAFLHGSPMHLLLNMLGLYFFGPRLEARLGGRRFALLYLLSGLGGAVLTFVLAPYASVVGASGAILGVLAGYARFWPEDRIYIWGIVPVGARMMVVGLAALSIFSGFTGAGAGTAHFAHLGGILAGWLYVVWLGRRRSAPGSRTAVRGLFTSRQTVDRWQSIRLDQLHEVNRAEAERVLAKLREGGPAALTAAEREFLDRMASR
ncbi:MAG TPA: rhomboid family intramembrane serine protease [Longimicrobiales bacterium]|nr:rhomboid family intramembrane serine protease [Longimicrobiales bacterium]